jgi:type I restriction enzyme S subunit
MKTLDNYIKQIRGISYKPTDISATHEIDYIPILKANNITENGLNEKKLIYIHKSKVKNEQLIKKGDLLLAASSGSKEIVGKHIYFDKDYNGSFGAFCKVVRPKENINSKYLSLFFKTPIFRNHIRKVIQGANINNLKNGDIDKLKIPVFTLKEQNQIAIILSESDTLIQQRKESIVLLDEFVKSTFYKMFGDPVRNEKKWEKTNVGKYTDCIVPGRDKPKSFTGDIPWIRTDDLNNKGFFTKSNGNIGLTSSEISEVGGKIIPVGSVNMTCVGQLNIISINKVECIINQQLHSFQCHENLNNIFLMFALSCQEVFMYKNASTTTVAYMNKTICNSIPIIVPPLDLQNQFATIVEKAEVLKSLFKESLHELENLFGALSQKAFKGELVMGNLVFGNIDSKEERGITITNGNDFEVSKDDVVKEEVNILSSEKMMTSVYEKAFIDEINRFKNLFDNNKTIFSSVKEVANNFEILNSFYIKFDKNTLNNTKIKEAISIYDEIKFVPLSSRYYRSDNKEKLLWIDVLQSEYSHWLISKGIIEYNQIDFNENEGITIFEEEFNKKNNHFTFENFKNFLIKEKIKFDYKQLMEFIFKLLDKGKIRQKFVNDETIKSLPHNILVGKKEYKISDDVIWFYIPK